MNERRRNREFPVIESTENFAVGRSLVRIWRNEEELKPLYDNEDIIRAAHSFATSHMLNVREEVFRIDLIRMLTELPRINAVEVQSLQNVHFSDTPPRKSGVVVYTEWP